MSYHDALSYLTQKTSVIELYDQIGGRLAVCPEWSGRIMTSTCEGLQGESFGCINIRAIEEENVENFGGEDQWTTSPLNHSFIVESIKENEAVLQRTVRMTDANGDNVEVDISRSISLLDKQEVSIAFGDAAADSFEREDVSLVGFYTENTVQTLGEACIASRLRGMFNASPNTVIVFSTPPEDCWVVPLPIHIDHFGGSPHGRIRHLPQTLLFRADGQGRSQVTIPHSNVLPIFGAIELRFGILTLWSHVLSNDSEENMMRIFNSGHTYSNQVSEYPYYEMNCFSAAQELLPGDSLTHCQSVLHINANNDVLDDIVRQIFNISLGEIAQKMLR